MLTDNLACLAYAATDKVIDISEKISVANLQNFVTVLEGDKISVVVVVISVAMVKTSVVFGFFKWRILDASFE